MLRLLEDKIATPLGPLWVIADEQFSLRAVEWEEHSNRMEELLDIHYRTQGYERISATNPGGLSDKLTAYFEGDLSIIDTLPTATAGTPSSVRYGRHCAAFPAGMSCTMASSPSS
jgi:methylated-DNA-[protein]-cysteine S-methyltransferase